MSSGGLQARRIGPVHGASGGPASRGGASIQLLRGTVIRSWAACLQRARKFGELAEGSTPQPHEAHVPAEEPQAGSHPRLPQADADEGRPPRLEAPPCKAAQATDPVGDARSQAP